MFWEILQLLSYYSISYCILYICWARVRKTLERKSYIRSDALDLQDAQNLVAGDVLHLRDTEGVTQSDTDLGRRQALWFFFLGFYISILWIRVNVFIVTYIGAGVPHRFSDKKRSIDNTVLQNVFFVCPTAFRKKSIKTFLASLTMCSSTSAFCIFNQAGAVLFFTKYFVASTCLLRARDPPIKTLIIMPTTLFTPLLFTPLLYK